MKIYANILAITINVLAITISINEINSSLKKTNIRLVKKKPQLYTDRRNTLKTYMQSKWIRKTIAEKIIILKIWYR